MARLYGLRVQRTYAEAPTQRVISNRSGVSKSTIDRELKILLALNLVTRDDPCYAIKPGAHDIDNGGWTVAYGG